MTTHKTESAVPTRQSAIVAQDASAIKDRLQQFAPDIVGKTFVISGGAGFLGSWFCDVAITLGAKVICIDNLIASTKENIAHLMANPNFTFIEKDIAKVRVPDGADYVVHMASIASPPLYQMKPVETLNSAVLGSINLLDYAKRNRVAGYLLTSTSEVYGNPPAEQIPTPETYSGDVHSYGPRSMYDESKRVEEAYCFAYRDHVPVRIARIFNTYGPRIDAHNPSQYGRVLIKFIHQALSSEPITVYDDGSRTRSFCYVVDQIVGLYRLLLTSGIDGEVVNIGNDHETTIKELAEQIVALSGSPSPVLLNSRPKYNLQHDPERRKPDIARARALLTFEPEISLADGLSRTIEWVRTGLEPAQEDVLRREFEGADDHVQTSEEPTGEPEAA